MGGRRRAPPPEPRTASGLQIVDTSVWGPPLWKVLHTVAATAPPAVWDALRVSLPCPDCEAHYNQWYVSRPPPAGDARQWLLDLHNNVNSRRRVPVWSMEQVAAAYETAPDRVESARGALESLRGIIGTPAFDALMAALSA